MPPGQRRWLQLSLALATAGACSANPGNGLGDAGNFDAGDSGSPPVADAGDAGDGGALDAGDAGDSGTADAADFGQPQVGRSIALSADGNSIWVVNADSDSISQLDIATRTLVQEILLAGQPVVRDPVTLRYDPAVRPRGIALVDSLHKAYVAGQSANAILVVDTQSASVLSRIPVGAEPVAVVATKDGSTVYAVSHEAATVSKIDTSSDQVVGTLAVAEHPWGVSLRADGSLLYVTEFLRNPGLTVIDTSSFAVATTTVLPDQPVDPTGIQFIPSGQPRGVYAAVPRPNTGEIWLPHMLLATAFPQPTLVFNSTAFPTFSILAPGGATMEERLLFQFMSLQGTFPGSFIDVVSGPRDVAFTPDGTLALVANAQSEDVMVFDAQAQVEVALVRPTPSTLIEGIVVDASGSHAYLQGRNSHNVTVLDIAESDGGAANAQVAVDGDPIECFANGDPMAPDAGFGDAGDLRHGQRMFFTSNSAAYPVTQNFWIACSTCHLEGQSDAVTWKFAQGPRDTPSNAGGPINTGFLFRQAVRNNVIDYDQTIRVEQGGFYHRDDPTQIPDLEALTDFTNYAIPFPQNPNSLPDGGLTTAQAAGQALFFQPIVPLPDGGLGPRCAICHAGSFYTDSASGNPSLVLGTPVTALVDGGPEFPVLLHDMTDYTCVGDGGTEDYLIDGGSDPWLDQPSTDIDGGERPTCWFDTPTLRGVFASPPYLHDGSAGTLQAAIAAMPNTSDLDDAGLANLAAFVQTL